MSLKYEPASEPLHISGLELSNDDPSHGALFDAVSYPRLRPLFQLLALPGQASPFPGDGELRTSVSFLEERAVCERNRDPSRTKKNAGGLRL